MTKLNHKTQTAVQYARCVRDHNSNLLDLNWHRNHAQLHAWHFEKLDRSRWIYWTAVQKWLDRFIKNALDHQINELEKELDQ